MALPYITNVSPTQAEPFFCTGSHDILTSIRGYAERRPGFASALETGLPTAFTNPVRIFTWNRWDGTFIYMVCDTSAGTSSVYKMISGADNTFTLLYADGGSGNAFDFVVSNNTVYFSNGHVAKKWNPTIGVQNWGIVSPSTAPSLTTDGLYAVAYSQSASDWTSIINAAGPPDGSFAKYATTTQGKLRLTNYGFGFPAGTINVVGVQVVITGYVDASAAHPGTTIAVALTKDGTTVAGSAKTGVIMPVQINTTTTQGGSGDLWGATLANTDVSASTFGVLIYADTATDTAISIDAVKIIVYYIQASTPGATFQVGRRYQYCYGNSATGHVSSPSPTSQSTGVVTNASVGISVVASTDPQVNQIRVFGTTDGGGGNYFELPNSPFPNTTSTVYDTATDPQLNVNSIAPIPFANDPPTPFRGATYFNGRVWGFVNNKLFFSGLEEITLGVLEESFPSGAAGNFWTFDQNITGNAGLPGALVVWCGGRMYEITGDTLDTFRRALLSDRRGTRSLASIATLASMAAWFDSAAQLWATDGSGMMEPGQDIRPDLTGITPSSTASTFHASGKNHWFVFSTGSKLYVFDLDKNQWMPPWNIPCTAVKSCETSTGNYDLLVASGGKILKLNASSYNDYGSLYAWNATLGNLSLVPDFGKRFSYLAVGSYDQPSRLGRPVYIGLERGSNPPATVSILMDDDPTVATGSDWQEITGSSTPVEDALNRAQGKYLQQDVWSLTEYSGRRMAVQVTGAQADQPDQLYTTFLAYKEMR